MKKWVLIMVMAIMIMAGFNTGKCYAAYETDGLLIEDGVIVGYTGNAKTVYIPSSVTIDYNGNLTPQIIRGIGANAFANNMSIEEVIVTCSNGFVNYGAFRNCTNLKYVHFLSGVDYIDNDAFEGASPIMQSKASAVMDYAQKHNFCYTSADMDGSVGDGTDFVWSYDGTKMVITGYKGNEVDICIPDKIGNYTVKGISKEAFYGMKTLKSIYIPEYVECSLGAFNFTDINMVIKGTKGSSAERIAVNTGRHFVDEKQSYEVLPISVKVIEDNNEAIIDSKSQIIVYKDQIPDVKVSVNYPTNTGKSSLYTSLSDLSRDDTGKYYVEKEITEYFDRYDERYSVVNRYRVYFDGDIGVHDGKNNIVVESSGIKSQIDFFCEKNPIESIEAVEVPDFSKLKGGFSPEGTKIKITYDSGKEKIVEFSGNYTFSKKDTVMGEEPLGYEIHNPLELNIWEESYDYYFDNHYEEQNLFIGCHSGIWESGEIYVHFMGYEIEFGEYVPKQWDIQTVKQLNDNGDLLIECVDGSEYIVRMTDKNLKECVFADFIFYDDAVLAFKVADNQLYLGDFGLNNFEEDRFKIESGASEGHLADSQTGVEVEYADENVFDYSTRLNVSKEVDEVSRERIQKYFTGFTDSYDITLLVGEIPVQPLTDVKVVIPVPQGVNGEKCKVYRLESDGTFTNMNAQYADGKLEFLTDHFSIYVINDDTVRITGDVNGDGLINNRDAAMILRHTAGKMVLTDDQQLYADVNGDGRINNRDAAMILRIVAGK